MARDEGNLFVLEGVLISLILLGAAYTVSSIHQSSLDSVRPRAELDRLARDTLMVLDGLDDGNGTSLLDLYLAQQFHCALDAVPSTDDCHGRRSKNLSIKIDSYLPLGAGYAIAVGNGAGIRDLYRSPLPQGEAVAASISTALEWNVTFAVSELSCYDAASDVNLTLVPIDRGALSWGRWGNVTVGATETAGERAFTARWWNVTLPAATRPATGTFVANVTGNASLPGASSYGSCSIAPSAAALRDAIRVTPFSAAPVRVPLGGQSVFSVDITEIAAVPGASITEANVTVYEPLPPRGESPDTYVEAGRVALSGGSVRTGTWLPSPSTLYGSHPALLRVGVSVDGATVELRRVLVLDVALPSGEVPIDPPYRVSLQAWLADWG